MSNSNGKTRQERSSTLPTAPNGSEDKKQRQARQHAISHRPHASHGFTLHRNQAREETQRLGSEIANFLAPKSAVPSTAPSRSASRHPSGEDGSLGNASEKASAQQGGITRSAVPKLVVTWQDVRELRRSRQESEQHLRAGLESLSNIALTGSRQVDATLHGIQSNMRSALFELDSLRELTRSTSDTLSRFTRETVPTVTLEHEKQIAGLQSTYDEVESKRIVGLEKRLEEARAKVQVLKTRMSTVRNEVGEWEVKDAAELSRSRTRHRVFWTVIGSVLALLVLLLFPKQLQRVTEESVAAMPGLNQSDWINLGKGKEVVQDGSKDGLKLPPVPQEQQDDRLRIFDEL